MFPILMDRKTGTKSDFQKSWSNKMPTAHYILYVFRKVQKIPSDYFYKDSEELFFTTSVTEIIS